MRQQLGFERLQPRGQRGTALSNPAGADQPEGWFLGEALGVVNILIASQPAVYRLPHEEVQRQLRVLCTLVGQVPFV